MTALALFKIFLISGGMYAYYMIRLKNTTNHVFNRTYLLLTVGLSFVVAFVALPVFHFHTFSVGNIITQKFPVLAGDFAEGDGNADFGSIQKPWNLDTIIWRLYILGVALQGLILIKMIWRFCKMKRNAAIAILLNQKVCLIDHPLGPFSFFQTIFWNNNFSVEEAEGRQILFHEMEHVRMKHGWDLLFLELATTFAWFNPFFFIIKKELAAVHEFQADQAVLRKEDPLDYAATLLQTSINNKRKRLTHSFFNHPLKRRIMMVTQSTKNSSLASRMAGIGLCMVLFFGLTSLTMDRSPSMGKIKTTDPITVVIDAGHGGIDAGAVGADGTTEKSLSLAIVQKIAALSPEYGVKVVLTRTGDELPGTVQTIRDGLMKRSEISNLSGARLLVSVHINAGQEEANGITVLIPGQEKKSGILTGSKAAGNLMVAALKEIYPTKPALLQPKQNVWILNNSEIPALLVECGNLLSADDLAFLKNPGNQDKLARKILEASIAFGQQEAAIHP